MSFALHILHGSIYPSHDLFACRDTVAGIVYMVSPFFILLVPSMFVANALVQLITPARVSLASEAAGIPSAGYRASQSGLLKGSMYISSIGILAAIIGVSLPL